MRVAAVASLIPTVASAFTCPGSWSPVHAWAEVEASVNASCQDVMQEIKARVTGEWHDPHNGGTYSLQHEGPLRFDLERVTGNKLFTDKMIFEFVDRANSFPSCEINACSESQIFSIKDFSTNYCNLRNLYCGKGDGCVPVLHDFHSYELDVETSKFAGKDKDACIVEPETERTTPMLRATPQTQDVLLGATVDETLACISDNCPLDEFTLQPKPSCVLGNCTSNLAKCLFSSSCRHGVMCELKCTEPLAKTAEAEHFSSLMECMRVHCPGFPPEKTCAALHCGVEAASCAVHSKCCHALECADKCVPGKYAAALAAMPRETII